MSELNPCPFCGEINELKLYRLQPGGNPLWHYVVACYCCGAESGWSRDKGTTLAKCNTRASDTSITKLEHLLKQRDGGGHDADCKWIYNYSRQCNCGNDAVVK